MTIIHARMYYKKCEAMIQGKMLLSEMGIRKNGLHTTVATCVRNAEPTDVSCKELSYVINISY